MKEFIHPFLTSLTDLGYFGIALGLMLEIIPSEIVLSYAGFLVAQGKISFIGAIIAGTVGGTIAQQILYWVGFYGGRPFIKKYGKYLLIGQKHIEKSEAWFDKYGSGIIFMARFVPIIRHAISIPAGIVRMSFIKFIMYTTFALIPWSIFFVYLGVQVGGNWEQINEMAKPYIQPVIAMACIITAAYILITIYKRDTKH